MYEFKSEQVHMTKTAGKNVVKRNSVIIKNGKGVKSVVVRDGKKVRKATRRLTGQEIKNIRAKKFMPKLFHSCQREICTRKNRRN